MWRIVGDVVGGLLIACMAVCVVGFLAVRSLFAEPEHRGPSDAEITALAQDAHVIVGELPLVLPVVAMPDQVSGGSFFSLDRRAVENERRKERDAFLQAASSSKSAPVLKRVKVRVETYGWNDHAAFAWEKICGRLTRNWARTVCDDSRAALNQALPKNDFYLVDDRSFDLFNGHETLGREIVADQLRAMDMQSGLMSLVCDVELGEHGRNCTAAVPIAQHLVAVWWIWERESESAEAQADREGRAIVAFVNYALSAKEDFEALLAVVCTARRPGSDRSMNRTAPADPCPE